MNATTVSRSRPGSKSLAPPAIPAPHPAQRVLATERDPAATLLRVALAIVIFPHGAQHLLGWFGGYGFTGTHEWMTDTLGFPGALAAVAIVTEFVAPVALLVGLLGRPAALGVAGIMAGALAVHLPSGFFMNWFGALPAGEEGFEYHLLVIAMALALVVRGSGGWSLDRAITARWRR